MGFDDTAENEAFEVPKMRYYGTLTRQALAYSSAVLRYVSPTFSGMLVTFSPSNVLG
jgi:hypothetical protein